MKVRCEVCGDAFEAQRRTARFCGSKCRMRAHRGAEVVPLRPEPARKPAPRARRKAAANADEESQPVLGQVEAAVTKQLADAERLATPLGQAALVLARRLDSGKYDTGSAMASLVRQLEATLESATADAKVADDPVDELRRRRDRKLGFTG